MRSVSCNVFFRQITILVKREKIIFISSVLCHVKVFWLIQYPPSMGKKNYNVYLVMFFRSIQYPPNKGEKIITVIFYVCVM